MLSDAKGEAHKAYHVGRGLLGLVEARMTVVIDSKGIVRYVFFKFSAWEAHPEKHCPFRDSLDTTLNFSAHVKFVTKWLEKLNTEEAAAESG